MSLRLLRLMLIGCVAAPWPASAAEPLDWVPADAFVTVRFASLDDFDGGTGELLDAIGPVMSSVKGDLGDMVEEMSMLKSRDAVGRSAPVVFIAFPFYDQANPVAAIVPTSDAAALQRALLRLEANDAFDTEAGAGDFSKITGNDRTFHFCERDGYAIYTPNASVAERLGTGDDFTGLNSALGEKSVGDLKKHDVSIGINAAPVIAKYKPTVQGFRVLVKNFIGGFIMDETTPNADQAREVYGEVADLAIDFVVDLRTAVVGLDFDADGAKAEVRLSFQPDSVSSKRLAQSPPVDLQNLDVLPAGAPIYGGFNVQADELAEGFLRASYGEVQDPEAVDVAWKDILASKVGSTVMSFALPTDDKTGTITTTIEEAEDIQKYRRAWKNFLDGLGPIKSPVFTQTMTYDENVEKYKDYSIDMIKTSMELGDSPEIQLVSGLLQRFMGGDGLQSRLTVVDQLLVQVTGNNPRLMQGLLDRFESGEDVIGLQESYAATRDHLSEQSNALLLVNAPKLVVDMFRQFQAVPVIAAALGSAGFNLQATPPASFAGISVATEENGLVVRAYVPASQPKGLVNIFAPGQQ